jgi:Flp pilus assembly protein TadG
VSPLGRGGEDSGAVAVLVALLLTVMMVLGAFALDIGNAYAQGRQISVAMDAAALSAAAKVGQAMPLNTACTSQVLSSIGAQAIAQAEADAINTKNRKNGLAEPVQSVEVSCQDGGSAVQITVGNSRGVPTALAGVIGVDTVRPANDASARYVKRSVAGGLRPWAVCTTTLTQAQANPGTTYWTALGNWNTKDSVGICGSSAPGNWGSVDFDDGGNSAGDLADWTRNGYPGPVDIPDPALPADPGTSNSSALRDAFRSLVNQVVLFPAVDGISGSGQNAVFDAVGIGTVKVCGVVYQNSVYTTTLAGTPSDCWRTPSPPTTTTTDDDTEIGPITVKGSVSNQGNTARLTVPAATFDGVPSGDGITNVAVITVAGAGGTKQNPAPQTWTVTLPDPLPTTTVTMTGKATNEVVNRDVTITITSTEVTTTLTGGFGLYDDKGNLQDQIQFRWVNYTTSSYTGPGGSGCPLTDPTCVGQTVLWR